MFWYSLTERDPAYHWCRLVKNIGWANQNIGGKVAKSDKCMGISQLLGGHAWGCSPKSMAMLLTITIDVK